jgi:hypothetical protein
MWNGGARKCGFAGMGAEDPGKLRMNPLRSVSLFAYSRLQRRLTAP